MARRRKYKSIVDPLTVATIAVTNFKLKVKTDLNTMKTNYEQKLKAYIDDTDRQALAAIRMAAFYAGIRSPEVRSAIRTAINQAKSIASEILATLEKEGKLPVAVIPKQIQEEAKPVTQKLAGIIIGVPAKAPAGA